MSGDRPAERVRAVPVGAATVKCGDVVSVDGIHHEVRDMYALPGNRKLLHFTDGGRYVIGTAAAIYAYRTSTGL